MIIVNGLAVNNYHKALHLGCYSSSRSASDNHQIFIRDNQNLKIFVIVGMSSVNVLVIRAALFKSALTGSACIVLESLMSDGQQVFSCFSVFWF